MVLKSWFLSEVFAPVHVHSTSHPFQRCMCPDTLSTQDSCNKSFKLSAPPPQHDTVFTLVHCKEIWRITSASPLLDTARTRTVYREVKIPRYRLPKPQQKLLLLNRTSCLVTIIIKTTSLRGKGGLRCRALHGNKRRHGALKRVCIEAGGWLFKSFPHSWDHPSCGRRCCRPHVPTRLAGTPRTVTLERNGGLIHIASIVV